MRRAYLTRDAIWLRGESATTNDPLEVVEG